MKRRARILTMSAVALVVAGSTLVYVGTRGHSQAPFERHLSNRSSSGGYAVGELHVVGGPARQHSVMPDSPLPGTIEAYHPGDPVDLYHLPIGANGRFRMQLAPGDYELVARPTNANIDPPNSQVVTIREGQTVHVDFVIQAT